jgi:hypothetical protein
MVSGGTSQRPASSFPEEIPELMGIPHPIETTNVRKMNLSKYLIIRSKLKFIICFQ